MKAFRDKYLTGMEKEQLKILDLGSCDVNGSYRPLFNEAGWTYQGLDLENGPNVDIILKDPYRLTEVRSRSADVFISGQAFEHIEYFWITMLEIARVLKTGGLCCIIAPSGGYEHRYPLDCWRFYPDGFAALARFAGLEKKEIYTLQDKDCGKFTDESIKWKDTIMICTKPELSWWSRMKFNLVNRILCRSLRG